MMINKLTDEQFDLISKLNSQEYGFILDLLDSSKKSINDWRKKNGRIPFELKSLQSLVRRILEFIEDLGIEPICEVGQKLNINAMEAINYEYYGEPFASNDEKKMIMIQSSGWYIPNSGYIISRPRACEITE